MIDISAIGGALGALKAAKDITEAMIGLRDAVAFQEKRFELQSRIMDAQSSVFAANDERATLIEEVAELKRKISQFEHWEAEKQRYDLINVAGSGSGTFAYRIKDDCAGSEPLHYICPTCYQQGLKSILQSEMRMPGRAQVLACHKCHSDVVVSKNSPVPMSGRIIRS